MASSVFDLESTAAFPLPLDSKETLTKTWTTCQEVKQLLQKGPRFRNLSKRIWFLEQKPKPGGGTMSGHGEAPPRVAAPPTLRSEAPSDAWDWQGGIFDVPTTSNWAQQQREGQRRRAAAMASQQAQQAQQIQHSQSYSAPILQAPQPRPGYSVDWARNLPTSAPSWAQALYSNGAIDPSDMLNSTLTANAVFSPPGVDPYTISSLTFSNSLPGTVLPVLHSSFGSYQPTSGPYARFLTPSPGPSVLDAFEDIDPDVDADAMSYQSIWRGLESSSSGAEATDPFSGMDVPGGIPLPSQMHDDQLQAQHPSQQVHRPSLETLARRLDARRDSARLNLEGIAGGEHGAAGDGGERFDDTYQTSPMPSHSHFPPSLPAGYANLLSTAASLQQPDRTFRLPPREGDSDFQPSYTSHSGSPLSHDNPFPPIASTSSAAGFAWQSEATHFDTASHSAETEPDAPAQLANRKSKGKMRDSSVPVKKSRNSQSAHSGGYAEGPDAAQTPICSHCASISTPLWRRGPDEELLCNACGLYLKLHNKPRPQTFKKQNQSRGAVVSIIAEAAASGTVPKCHNCETVSTPMWRKTPEGGLCCNACALYKKLHNIDRPVSLARKQQSRQAAKANIAQHAAPTSYSQSRPTTASSSSDHHTLTGLPSSRSPEQEQHHAPPQQPDIERPPVLPPMSYAERAPRRSRSEADRRHDAGAPVSPSDQSSKRFKVGESWERSTTSPVPPTPRLPQVNPTWNNAYPWSHNVMVPPS